MLMNSFVTVHNTISKKYLNNRLQVHDKHQKRNLRKQKNYVAMGIETEKKRQTTLFNYNKILFSCVVFRKVVKTERKNIAKKNVRFSLLSFSYLIHCSQQVSQITTKPNNIIKYFKINRYANLILWYLTRKAPIKPYNSCS